MDAKQDDACSEIEKCEKLVSIRWSLAILSSIGYTLAFLVRFSMGIAIIPMTQLAVNTSLGNSTMDDESGYDWSESEKSFLLGAFFYGFIMSQVPFGFFIHRCGAYHVLSISLAFAGLCSALIPFASDYGVWYAFVMQFCVGVGQGSFSVGFVDFWSAWAPNMERGRIMGIFTTGSSVGLTILGPFAGFIATNFGWRCIFYSTGFGLAIWSVVWYIMASRTPRNHRWMTEVERDYILESRLRDSVIGVNKIGRKNAPFPWLKLLATPQIQAILVMWFTNSWTVYILLAKLPTFLHQVLHYPIQKNGLTMALPFSSYCLSIFMIGYLIDYFKKSACISTTLVRKLTVLIGFIPCGIFIFLIGFFMHSPYFIIAALVMAMIFQGIVEGGYAWINIQESAPEFSGQLLGMINTIACSAGFIAPLVVNAIVGERGDNEENWRYVFFTTALINFVNGTYAAIFSKSKQVPWLEAYLAKYAYQEVLDKSMTEVTLQEAIMA